MSTVETKYLTTAEVADLCRCNAATIRRWRKKGILKGRKLPGGKDWLFDKDDVEQALRDSEEG